MIFVITVHKMLWTHVEQPRESIGLQQILTTLMTNIIGDNNSTDNAKLLSICVLPQYSTSKKALHVK